MKTTKEAAAPVKLGKAKVKTPVKSEPVKAPVKAQPKAKAKPAEEVKQPRPTINRLLKAGGLAGIIDSSTDKSEQPAEMHQPKAKPASIMKQPAKPVEAAPAGNGVVLKNGRIDPIATAAARRAMQPSGRPAPRQRKTSPLEAFLKK